MGLLNKKGIYDTGKVLFLPVDAIVPNPDQPRKHFSQPELEELLRFANQAAALTTTRSGAIPAMPSRAEVEACLARQC